MRNITESRFSIMFSSSFVDVCNVSNDADTVLSQFANDENQSRPRTKNNGKGSGIVLSQFAKDGDQSRPRTKNNRNGAGTVLSQIANARPGSSAMANGDRSRPRTKNNRYPHVDEQLQLSNNEMVNNMFDYSDTIQPIDFAPATKQLMLLSENEEKMFSMPGCKNWLLDPGIIRFYQSHLVSPLPEVNVSVIDELQQDLRGAENIEVVPVAEHVHDNVHNNCNESGHISHASSPTTAAEHTKRATKRFLRKQRDRKGRVFIKPKVAPEGVKPNNDEEFELETVHALFIADSGRKAFYVEWRGFNGKDSWTISEDVNGLEIVQSFTEVTSVDTAMDALIGTPIPAHFSSILANNPKYKFVAEKIKASEIATTNYNVAFAPNSSPMVKKKALSTLPAFIKKCMSD